MYNVDKIVKVEENHVKKINALCKYDWIKIGLAGHIQKNEQNQKKFGLDEGYPEHKVNVTLLPSNGTHHELNSKFRTHFPLKKQKHQQPWADISLI